MRAMWEQLMVRRFFSLAAAGFAGALLFPAIAAIDTGGAVSGRAPIFGAGLCMAAEGGKVPPAGLSAKKSALEQKIAQAFALVSRCKLQEAREAAASIELSLEEIRNSLAKTDVSSFSLRIEKIRSSIVRKEDSLVSKNLAILRSQGVDAAFEFMQDVAWKQGVSKEKLDMIENSILNEAPAIEQAQESEIIDRTVKQLENKETADPDIDPYILKTAEVIVQSHADSAVRAQQAQALTAEPAPETTQPVAAAPIQEKPAQPEPTPEPPEPVQEKPADAVIDEQEPVVAVEPPAPVIAPALAPAVPAVAAAQPRAAAPKPEEYMSPALAARIKARQEFLSQFKAEKETAKKLIMDLYDMIEKGQTAEAFAIFRQRREFIAKRVNTQAFNVLELTLAQSSIDAQGAGAAAAPHKTQIKAPEQKSIDRIEGLMRENKVETAYAEFKRVEVRLKNFMQKNEFKQLKSMVERSYKLRTGGPKK